MEDQIAKAVEILKAGGVVAMPTETVYGLAADIKNPVGIDTIFSTKKRPFFDPLIVHIAHMVQIKTVVSEFEELPQFLAEKFWPGPLTMVLPKNKNLNPKITSGLETVGVRFPKHSLAQKLIHKLGSPVAAPSANLFGKTSPTTAQHVRDEFKEQVFVIDGGPCEFGLESTVIGFDPNYTIVKIYRPGYITKEDIKDRLKGFIREVHIVEEKSQVAPGHLEHHYMPEIPLVIYKNKNREEVQEEIRKKLNLKSYKFVEMKLNSDPAIAARELYQKLRDLSQSGANIIMIEEKEEYFGGLWTAIWDRVTKAATLKIGER